MASFAKYGQVKVTQEYFQAEEVHSNCDMKDLDNYKICDLHDNFLTCAKFECEGDAFRCVCHVVTDMGG